MKREVGKRKKCKSCNSVRSSKSLGRICQKISRRGNKKILGRQLKERRR